MPLALLALVLFAASAGAATIQVSAGGSLQAAINAAQPGDLIALQPGATYTGNFVLPDKGTSVAYITIRTGGGGTGLPGAGTRVGPSASGSLAIIRSPNTMSALSTAPGAHHWRLELLEFCANVRGYGEIIALGSGGRDQSTLAAVPHDLVLDRVLVRGDALTGQKRGIGLNSAATTISNSYVSDCKGVGFDTQAVGGWNGPGPFTITNNYLEGAGENVLFGGASPIIPNLIPSGITFTRNDVIKPVAWKNPILGTPTGLTAAPDAGGGLAAATYYYFVVAARATAQDSWAWSGKSAEVAATVGDGGRGHALVDRGSEGRACTASIAGRRRAPRTASSRRRPRRSPTPAGLAPTGMDSGVVDQADRLVGEEPLRAEGGRARPRRRQRVRERLEGIAERLRHPLHAAQPGQHVALDRGARRHLLEQHRPPRRRRREPARLRRHRRLVQPADAGHPRS